MSKNIDVGLFKMAILGDYNDFIEKQKKAVAQGMTRAVGRATGGMQREMRRQTKKAGLGKGLEKAWRSERYPRRGFSMKPAGLVYSKATKIHAQYNEGTTITAKNKKFLAIPTDNVPKKGRGRMKPKDFKGQLDFIPSKNRKSGVLVRRSKDGEQKVMFILLKQVRGKKLLNIEAASDKWGRKIPAQAAREMARAAKQLGLN